MLKNKYILLPILLLLFLASSLFAQTTGKIIGTVTDKQTGEPLIGVNVVVEGRAIGAATDVNGQFYIINISPGKYNVNFSMIGYTQHKVEEVRVSVNRTTTINAALQVAAVQGEVVIVTASMISTKKDQTGSIQNVSADKIEELPVQSLGEVINMQVGVVQGHFRGGRSGEVQYMTDGMNVGANVEKDVVAEVEVITGIFSAKYGRAMSGIVNAVTKDGSNKFHAKLSSNFENYYTTHNDIFWGLDATDFARTKDFNLFMEGPILKNKLNYVLNYRNKDYVGHLNGERLFNPWDYNDYTSEDSTNWIREQTGDGETVPMNTSQSYSAFSKLTFKPVGSAKLSFTWDRHKSESQGYSHGMKFNPDGRGTSHNTSDVYTLQWNHMVGTSFFYEFKVAYEDRYSGSYKYKDPISDKYIHPLYSGRSDNTGFSTGGESQGYYKGENTELNIKGDINWQINQNHGIMAGFLLTEYDLNSYSLGIQNKWASSQLHTLFIEDSVTNHRIYLFFEPVVMADSTVYTDTIYPNE